MQPLDSAINWTFPLCPMPPDWVIDWDGIVARYAWVAALAGTPQNPEYHGEGDVDIHTRMVAEALVALPEWRGLGALERSVLFAAALLHDVAKPATTQIEGGRIVSPGHARLGAAMTHSLLWNEEGFDGAVPFSVRDAIARLVRHHGLPLWFWEKDDPIRAVVAAAQVIRLDWVALLAEADVRGRISADRQALLDRVTLFREYAAEQGCLAMPYAFASDHSRFVYFHRPGADITYAAYDDTTCEVLLLAGLPGVGKDTWLRRNHPELPVISLDAIRAELGIAPTDGQGAVIQAAHERARVYLRRGESFAWNATNITRTLRGQLIDLFTDYRARTRIAYLDAPADTVWQRNGSRERQVPESVIRRLIGKLEVPDLTEAHQVEWIF